MNIWLTSDTHYGHKNIAGEKVSRWGSGYRHFDSVEEMNKALIKNINDHVKEDDILYHLGDFAFGYKNVIEFRKAIKCKNIHLIFGNHDEHIEKHKDLQDLFTSVSYVFTGYIGKTYLHLSHYSHNVWPKSHRGSIHLFGHSHGSLPGKGKSMDVGIDCHKEFRPYHLGEVVDTLAKIDISVVDHHLAK